MRTVADDMAEPVLLDASATIQESSAAMLDRRTEAAVVMRDGAVAGLVTAGDVARAMAEGLDVTVTAVGDIAARSPIVRDDEPLVDVHVRLRSRQCPLAVVVDRDGRPVGILEDAEAAP